MKKILALLWCLLGAAPLLAAEGHPRLLAKEADWERLKQQRSQDPLLDQLVKGMRENADATLTMPTFPRVKDGRRILQTSRAVLARISTLGVVYKLEGDPKYAERAIRELEAVAAYEDWNPSHFLDVAELCTAFAIGYDWFYAEMTPAQREKIRDAIITKALQPALAGDHFWKTSTNNWNSVCWGGLLLGALAIEDEAPELSRNIINLAREGLPLGLRAYAPDGVYPEGPMYWTYGTSYLAVSIAALQTALGTDWGLAASPGFIDSARWVTRETTAQNRYYNFSDGRESAMFNPALLWFAKHSGDPGILYGQKALLEKLIPRLKELPLANKIAIDRSRPENDKLDFTQFFPLTVVWWQSLDNVTPQFSKDAQGNGPNPVAVFRNDWDDPRSLYLGIKGGSPAVSHGHMDAGSFVFDCKGQRWAVDLGLQDYNALEKRGVKIWEQSGRWTVYRLNNYSHNTLTINDQLHNVQGTAKITDFKTDTVRSATVDLSPTFKGQADAVTRRFEIVGQAGVKISDQLAGLKAGDKVTWRMMTPAAVEASADGKLLLQQGGENLDFAYQVNGGTVGAAIRPATPPNDYDAPNPGVNEITLTVTAKGDEPLIIETTLTAR